MLSVLGGLLDGLSCAVKGGGVEGLVVSALVLGIVFGTCALVVAQEKGRSGIGYFLFGLSSGPIGLLGAILVDPRLPATPDRWAQVRCMRCGKTQNVEVDPKEFTCWQCEQRNEIPRPYWAYREQRPPADEG